LIILQESPDNPITAGIFLEEVAHLKLGLEQHPSYAIYPERFSAEDPLKMEVINAIGHYYAFKLIQDNGGGDCIKARDFASDFIENLVQTQTLEDKIETFYPRFFGN
jgi:hypothetical protein